MGDFKPSEDSLRDMDEADKQYAKEQGIDLEEVVDIKTDKEIAKMLGVEPKLKDEEPEEDKEEEPEDKEVDKEEADEKED